MDDVAILPCYTTHPKPAPPMFSIPRLYFAFALASVISSDFVCSQEPELKAELTQLVSKLGSSDFTDRERAASKILNLGPSAISQIKTLPLSTSREIQGRLDAVLAELEQKNFKLVSESFLSDTKASNSHGLPSWNAFRELVGSSRNSKLLFLQVLKSHTEIAEMIERIYTLRQQGRASSDQETQLAAHCAMRSGQLLSRYHRRGGLEVGDCIAMLFATSTIEGLVPYEVSELIRSLSRQDFLGSMSRPSYKPIMLELLGRWIPKSPESMAPEVMMLARRWDLKQVLPLSRRHLSKSFDPMTREQALLCLIAFGDQSDVDELVKHANDPTIIHQYIDTTMDGTQIVESLGAPPGALPVPASASGPVQKVVRVCDLAVAAAMKLNKDDLRQVFPNYTPEDFSLRWKSTVSVLESEQKQRDEAIHVWIAQLLTQAVPSNALKPVPDSKP
jgi:hypothetical protein